ncbi:hypothetical protein QYF36_021576 [Acer negundo]|nr:hypothetical protein QYF36_021576 [Acer negundo]
MPGSGSLGRIYGSVMNLNSSYLQPNVSKDVVLRPKLSSSSTIDSIPLLKNFASKKRKCDQYGTYGSSKAAKVYPSSTKRGAATSSNEKQGFVRGLVKYIVMDSLFVMPISTFSVMSLLNHYRVKDFSSLRRKLSSLTSTSVWSGLRLHLHQTQSSLMKFVGITKHR